MRLLLRIAIALAGIYVLLLGGLLAVMTLPPKRSATIIAKLPGPALFRAVPFAQLWSIARGGRLRPGEAAPDFELKTTDKKSLVRLSSFRGQKPVVLVFGSYT